MLFIDDCLSVHGNGNEPDSDILRHFPAVKCDGTFSDDEECTFYARRFFVVQLRFPVVIYWHIFLCLGQLSLASSCPLNVPYESRS